jgi:ADP-glucose pyrophosphorylase
LFSTLRNTATAAYSFGGAYRVVEFSRPKIEIIRSGMQILGVFGQEKNSLLLRMFELVHFL